MNLPKGAGGRIVYDSWKNGSDIYKDSNGYFIFDWDAVKEKDYKNYLPKSWKPSPPLEETPSRRKTSKRNKKQRKTISKK